MTAPYTAIPEPNHLHTSRGYGHSSTAEMSGGLNTSSVADYAAHPADASPLHQAGATTSRPQSSYSRANVDGDDFGNLSDGAGLHRTISGTSSTGLSRGNTLKKKGSVSRKSSLKRSGSRKSLRAGSIKGFDGARSVRDGDDTRSVYYTPIPTSGTPTEILANRFQAWRKLLKDLITYFREVQTSYEQRAKAVLKVSNLVNNLSPPPAFLNEGGLFDANNILRDYHRQSIAEANKAREIESDVINHLTILRADLNGKIKEIKSLSGDFKNTVEKEKDGTRKVVHALEEALAASDHDPAAVTGKDDPFLIRLAVDRQVEKQIDEENYLHRAYLNLEGSGRELEAIVVGEIQKAYNALAGILQREANEATTAAVALRSGPVSLPKDYEWKSFVNNDPHFVNPEMPLRTVDDLHYPGKFAPQAAEVRAGMLERKSKYLKSYTPGWYVLSPTHLHEFKSADRIYSQPPVMSLYLADQKLGSRSQPGSSSHKFMLKGKQTGSMHRGHSWVFRAESYDTMLAWHDDIKTLTEKTGEERKAFVRQHARSVSVGSNAGSDAGSTLDEDEADAVPFSANASRDLGTAEPVQNVRPQRPSPGGRFPSDFTPGQYLQRPVDGRPLSPDSGSSIDERDTISTGPPTVDGIILNHGLVGNSNSHQPPGLYGETSHQQQGFQQRHQQYQPQVDGANAAAPIADYSGDQPAIARHESNYRSWMAPAAGGALLGAGAVGAEQALRNKTDTAEDEASSPAPLESSKRTNLAGDATVIPVRDRALSNANTLETDRPSLDLSGSVAGTESTNLTSLSGEKGVAEPIDVKLPGQPIATTILPVRIAELPASSPVATGVAPVIKDGNKSVAAESGNEESKDIKHTVYDTDPASGQVNAKPTGQIFPKILRHDTDVSVRKLHVPGEWTGADGE